MPPPQDDDRYELDDFSLEVRANSAEQRAEAAEAELAKFRQTTRQERERERIMRDVKRIVEKRLGEVRGSIMRDVMQMLEPLKLAEESRREVIDKATEIINSHATQASSDRISQAQLQPVQPPPADQSAQTSGVLTIPTAGGGQAMQPSSPPGANPLKMPAGLPGWAALVYLIFDRLIAALLK